MENNNSRDRVAEGRGRGAAGHGSGIKMEKVASGEKSGGKSTTAQVKLRNGMTIGVALTQLHNLRWGEKYDGRGASIKYTDKWAEQSKGDGWSKWGDKWDENFDTEGHDVKQGETWWEGKYGEIWN